MELSVDGRRVTGTTGGRPHDPALPLLVLIHGAGHDHTAWQLQTRYFAHHGYRVLAVDLPGHGGSEGPAPDTIEGYAGWMGRLLDALEGPRAILVGHSMGSLIALDLAGTRPELVEALALLATTPKMTVHPDLLAAARADDHLAIELITGWTHATPARLGGNRTPGIWMSGASLRLLERSAPGVLANDLAACARYEAALGRAAAVTVPTLVMVGERDLMTSPSGVPPLVEALADATLVTLPDTGHSMMAEQPDAVIDTLAGFLGGGSPSSYSAIS